MEEIFVEKHKVVATRMFLGTMQVWGPTSDESPPSCEGFSVCGSRAPPSLGLLWS